jgi:Bifunctional DNA primase/polymerase, N-terminal/Primase C terminal 1 (PriCT-1)
MPTQTNALLDAALSYAARGWHVFPCHTPTPTGCSCRRKCDRVGKHPRSKNGLKDATTDEAQIRRWWQMWPEANVAIRTGAVSGLVVLDNDIYKGGDTSLRELERSYSAMPETVLSLTGGGGEQSFFQHPGSPVKNGVDALGVGLDIRGDGGYVIAPPSLHRSGTRYVWEVAHEPDDTPLAPMPDWLRGLCQEARPHATVVEAGAPIMDVARNDTLFRLGCSFRAKGCTEAVILAALREMNATQCQPPLSDDEVITLAASCATYEPGWQTQGRPATLHVGQNDAAVGAQGLSSLNSLSSQNGEKSEEPVLASEEELNSLFSLNSQPTLQLREEAFHGLAGTLVRLISPHTESDEAALLMQLLTYFGAVVGRQPYYVVSATRHYPNLFGILVGPTGKARKGTAFDHVEALMKSMDSSWSDTRVIGGCGSGEGLIHAVRDPIMKREPIKTKGRITGYEEVQTDPGVIDKRLLVYEPEFASVLKVMSRDGNILSMTLRQAWDNGRLQNTVKTTPQKATNAHIAMIGHITTDELRKLLTTTEAGNGFGNRFLWMCVKRTKLLPEGGALATVNMREVYHKLREAYHASKTIGQMHRDADATRAWNNVYEPLSTDQPGLAGALLARSEPQVLRLSMLYALLDASAVIRPPHLAAALAVWQYAEASVHQIFGETTGNKEADTLRDALRWATAGKMTKSEVIREVFHGHIKAHELNAAIRVLVNEGLITRQFADSTGGRKREYLCYGDSTNTSTLTRARADYIKLSGLEGHTTLEWYRERGELSEKSEESPFAGAVPRNGENQPFCEESEKSEESPFRRLDKRDEVYDADVVVIEPPDDEPWPDPPEAPLTNDERFDEVESMYQQRAEEVPPPTLFRLPEEPPPCFACRGTAYWRNTSGMAICARCYPRPAPERS